MRAKDLERAIDDIVCRALEQDAQFREVRMPEIIDEKTTRCFAQQVRNFLLVNNLPQSFLVKKIKASSTAISEFLDCKYKGNVALLMRKLASFMDTFNRRKRRVKGPAYIETSVAKVIFAVIKHTESFSDERGGRIGMIIGDSGHGKSACLQEYAHGNPNSVYVEIDDTMTSTAIFSKIAKTLKQARDINVDYTGVLRKITEHLVDALEQKEMTVIIDEASALDVHKLNQLRQIISVRCKCPLIIAGNSHLLKTINDDAGKRGYESLDQFRSRLLSIVNLDALASTGRGNSLHTIEDIRKLYEYGGISLTSDAVKTLRRICCTPQTGRLWTCKTIIEALHLTRELRNGGEINTDYIVSIVKKLNLSISERLPLRCDEPEESEAEKQVAMAG
jgi:DNA transposition AAA+ family ATPase